VVSFFDFPVGSPTYRVRIHGDYASALTHLALSGYPSVLSSP
jgi:hypothetical protein